MCYLYNKQASLLLVCSSQGLAARCPTRPFGWQNRTNQHPACTVGVCAVCHTAYCRFSSCCSIATDTDRQLCVSSNWPPAALSQTHHCAPTAQDLQELVSYCLQKEPAERWTAKRLLKHRFWKASLPYCKLLMLVEDSTLPCTGPPTYWQNAKAT